MVIPLIEQLKNFYLIKKLISLVKKSIQGKDLKKTITIIMLLAMTYVLIVPLFALIKKIFHKKSNKEKSSSHRVYNKLTSCSYCSNSSSSSYSSSSDCSDSSSSSNTNKCKKNKCKKIKLSKEDIKKTLRNYKLN